MPGRDVISKMRETVDFTEWEKERYEKTGYIRWESILHFYTIDCIKAGYLRKNKGIWSLTDEGEKAIKLGPEQLLESASAAYNKWKASQDLGIIPGDETENEDTQSQQAMIDKYEEEALDGILPLWISGYGSSIAQGHGLSYTSDRNQGRDGGIDIIAYSDPIGAKEPRIKVQVKHWPDNSIAVDEIRKLVGLLSKPGDVGLFVTSGKFTSEAERSARESHIHIELINFQRFISLWQEYYDRFSDEVKNMLPLQAIYFLVQMNDW